MLVLHRLPLLTSSNANAVCADDMMQYVVCRSIGGSEGLHIAYVPGRSGKRSDIAFSRVAPCAHSPPEAPPRPEALL